MNFLFKIYNNQKIIKVADRDKNDPQGSLSPWIKIIYIHNIKYSNKISSVSGAPQRSKISVHTADDTLFENTENRLSAPIIDETLLDQE